MLPGLPLGLPLLGLLFVLSLLTVLFYALSVRPEAWSRRIGPRAYPLSGRLRNAAMACLFAGLVTFLALFVVPPPLPLPARLPWPYGLSLLAALLLALPAGTFLVLGVRDAGTEAATPSPETRLFGGIYTRIRHPQAWEGLAWMILALMLHSPFHVLYALFWLLLETLMVMAEEKDLRLRFGPAYEEYRRRTPAFFPRLGRR